MTWGFCRFLFLSFFNFVGELVSEYYRLQISAPIKWILKQLQFRFSTICKQGHFVSSSETETQRSVGKIQFVSWNSWDNEMIFYFIDPLLFYATTRNSFQNRWTNGNLCTQNMEIKWIDYLSALNTHTRNRMHSPNTSELHCALSNAMPHGQELSSVSVCGD